MAGVVVAVATVPENPFAVVTETEVTVPEVAGLAQEGGDPVVAVSICPVVPLARNEGIPVAPLIKVPLFAAVIPATTFVDEL
jgi:hypothetical protein